MLAIKKGGKYHQLIYTLFFAAILLLISFNSQAKFKAENFSQDYQYDYINHHASDDKAKPLTALKILASQTALPLQERYFIAHNYAYLLFKQHKKEETLQQLAKTVTLAKQLDAAYLAKTLLLQAKTHGILFRETEQALLDLNNALDAITKNQSKNTEITSLQFDLQVAMAQAYNQLSQLNKAQEHIEEALHIAENLADNNETIYALIIAGRIAYQKNELTKAFQHYLHALKLTDNSTPISRIASLELRLAIAYEAQEDFELALSHAKKAADLYNQLNSPRLQIKSLRVLGNIYTALNKDIDTALVHFLNALNIAKTIKSPVYIAQMQHYIGRAYLLNNEINQAEKYLKQAQTTFKKINAVAYTGLNTLELARLADKKHQPLVAIKLAEDIIHNKEFQQYPALIEETQTLLLTLYVTQNDYKKAYLLQQELLNNNNQHSNNKLLHAINNDILIKKLQNQLEESQITLQQQQQQKQAYIQQQKYLLLALFIVIAMLLLSFYFYHKLKKRYHNRIKDSQLTWPAFQKNLISANLSNETVNILASSATPTLNLSPQLCHYQKHHLIDQCFMQLKQIGLAQDSIQRHGVLWQICLHPLTDTIQKIEQLIQKKTGLPAQCLWIELNNFPRNISHECLLLIEELVYYFLQKATKLQYWQLLKITIEDKALPIIFTTKKEINIALGVEKAISQGFIRCDILPFEHNLIEQKENRKFF